MYPDATPPTGAPAPVVTSDTPVVQMVEIAPGVFEGADARVGRFRVLIENHTAEIPPDHTLPLSE